MSASNPRTATASDAASQPPPIHLPPLPGKFIGGSEEVLAGIDGEAEGFATMFDGVEKGEIVAIEEEVKVPLAQAEGALKVGDTIPSVGLWQGFPNDEKISLLDLGKDQVRSPAVLLGRWPLAHV